MKNNIEDLVKEALLINTRIKKDKDRLAELKNKILEDSTGKILFYLSAYKSVTSYPTKSYKLNFLIFIIKHMQTI